MDPIDLQITKAYLEALSIEIMDIRHLKNNGMPVITIDGRIPEEGVVATFQFHPTSKILYRMKFHPKSMEFVTLELMFQFT